VSKDAAARSAPRIVVLGANGQLGRALLDVPGIEMIGLVRRDLDLTSRTAIRDRLLTLHPDLVVNAAGYTAVDRAESEVDLAFAVNRDGAGYVADVCALLDIPLIHVSTDYVFDGTKPAPYTEDDTPNPLSVYGASKAAGEERVLSHKRAAVVRTSWLFGLVGANFVKTILHLAQSQRELRVVADQRGCPTSATDLAIALTALGRRMLADSRLAGIFHYAGAEPVSWHDFAAAILEAATPRLSQVPRLIAIPTSGYPQAATRPHNSVLACCRLAGLGLPPVSWRPALDALVMRTLTPALGNVA
jgi:dTDP-4-dehydrorhamnose reductase